MSNDLHLETTIPFASSQDVYEAWLDSGKHAAFTGDTADIHPGIGGKFSIACGYITGETLELEPYHRIVQSWRTIDFPEDAPDSILEILLRDSEKGCLLELRQTNLPGDQVDLYESGWVHYYFHPLIRYFSKKPVFG
ncbi:SRPBCC domain-containing protein [Leptolinea tardivitalis]|uniref:SRPBCC domain-containing protein n=1 Tax=Leptolinea tardivitalis TaxID=229920 RepID=UPI0007844BA7|nr:SRPBCC domain-containing protein [Leptolinea tardivitalis]GAP21277.1 uncharacterized conserved protein [Leptolinea tardivitalis]